MLLLLFFFSFVVVAVKGRVLDRTAHGARILLLELMVWKWMQSCRFRMIVKRGFAEMESVKYEPINVRVAWCDVA